MLSDKKSNAHSIFVIGNDVYVAGVTYDSNNVAPIVTLWKNGVATQVGPKGSTAYAIFVK